MAAAVPVLILASTAVQAYGAIQDANAASASAQSEAQAMDFNAEQSRIAAQEERRQALQRELAMRREANRLLGRQRAAIAQSGTAFTGSNLDMLEESSVAAELDALNTRYEGQLRARGLETQSQMDTLAAQNARRNAKAYRTSGYLKAGGSILSGAARYGEYKTMSGG